MRCLGPNDKQQSMAFGADGKILTLFPLGLTDTGVSFSGVLATVGWS